jgi:hypothetical protein
MGRIGFLSDRTLATPIAATTAPPTTSALASITGFIVISMDDLGRLGPLVFGLSFLVLVNRDHRGSLGEGTWQGSFDPARFTAPASASPSPSPSAAAWSGLSAHFVGRRIGVVDGLDLFDVSVVRFRLGFGLDFRCRFVSGIDLRFFLFRFLNGGRGGLLGDGAGLLRRVHLLAAFNQERLLAGHRGIGIDCDRDLEALFEITQMAALVIEQVERNVALRANDLIVGCSTQERFFNDAQQLQGD